jgi:hypothetical protein
MIHTHSYIAQVVYMSIVSLMIGIVPYKAGSTQQ